MAVPADDVVADLIDRRPRRYRERKGASHQIGRIWAITARKSPSFGGWHLSSADQLGQLVATAVTRYNESGTKFKTFNFMRNLTKSTESKEAVAYLENDFPRDIAVAKLNTSEEQWWTVPVKVIESLLGLGEPKKVSFATIQSDAQKLSPLIGKSNPRFSTGIGRLVPLKIPSTMHTILSEEWRKWQRPPTV